MYTCTHVPTFPQCKHDDDSCENYDYDDDQDDDDDVKRGGQQLKLL